jgi:ABC-2 type transport system ATP-binding protein
MTETLLDVRGLEAGYGATRVLFGIDLQVPAGSVTALLGANGAGKTSTLRCLAGILPATSGTITIAGHPLETEPVKAKREMAFVPDEPQLFEYLTVEEHLQFVARIYQVSNAASRSPVLLEELELTEHRQKLPGELSRGMRQKLAIACGLLHDPRVLLFDEPLTGLDPLSIRRTKDTILRRAREGAAVVLSSHLLHLVEELCTGVLIIGRGRRLAYGPLETIVAERPELKGMALEDVFLTITGNQPQ